MKNLSEIQTIISEYGRKLKERKNPKGLFIVLGEMDEFSKPFIEIKNRHYHYVVMERGREITRRTTQDLDDLLYWLISDGITKIASKWELRHRNEKKDFRRLLFAKEIELFNKINKKWAEKRTEYLNFFLEKAPYDDLAGLRASYFSELREQGFSEADIEKLAYEKYPEKNI